MSHSESDLNHMHITPMVDPKQDHRFYDTRSAYVERFWVSVLGPTAIWFLRLAVREFDTSPARDGIWTLNLRTTARRLGLGFDAGRTSALMRTIERCCDFGVARRAGKEMLEVRTALPPLPEKHHKKLPKSLRKESAIWERTADNSNTPTKDARVLARCLLEMGHGPQETAEQMLMLGVPMRESQRAVSWAWAESVSHPSVLPSHIPASPAFAHQTL